MFANVRATENLFLGYLYISLKNNYPSEFSLLANSFLWEIRNLSQGDTSLDSLLILVSDDITNDKAELLTIWAETRWIFSPFHQQTIIRINISFRTRNKVKKKNRTVLSSLTLLITARKPNLIDSFSCFHKAFLLH